MRADDTIFALASARGRAGVAVIRVSGPRSDAALSALTGGAALPRPREMRLRTLRRGGGVLDEALVVRFAEDASFTGEASAELHCHGGPAVVAAVLDALAALPCLREAEPGEFTRRAFDNGRLDLAQVEGLADLVNAETEAQRRAALRQSDGSLGRRCRDWSDRMMRALALLEATIDFADEEIPDATYETAIRAARTVRTEIKMFVECSISGERFRQGWRVALIGAPNAGKSSLINVLALRDVAITSPTAGTTRDAIEVALDLRGYPVTLIDTAGLRETQDEIERIGVSRARASAEAAELRIALGAADAPLSPEVIANVQEGDLRVWNKSDVAPCPDGFDLSVSAKTGDGLDRLVERIAGVLAFTDPGDADALLRRRHRAALNDALGALDRFDALAAEPDSPVRDRPEIAAEHLRVAVASLGTITGAVGVEALLDVIFSEFCLGK